MEKWHKSLYYPIEIMEGKNPIQYSFKEYENERLDYLDNPYKQYNLDKKSKWKILNGKSIVNMKGRAIGGCFDVIDIIIGTKYDNIKNYIQKYKEDGIIWFLEIFEMSTAKIYLKLWQMKNAGYFANCKGIILGRPLMVREDYEISYEDTLKQALESLDIPVIFDADIGHKPPQLAIVNGAILEVSLENGQGVIKTIFK